MKVEHWKEAYTDEIASWSYPPPYDFYDLASDPADAAAMRDPAQRWQPRTFRLFVTVWNERAIRLYERLGFREVGRETRTFERFGAQEFIRMERPA